MSEIHQLEFQFKGARTYVHGTDIFNAVSEFAAARFGVNPPANIEMNLHKIMRTQLSVEVLNDPAEPKRPDTCVTYTLDTPEGRRKMLLSEDGRPVNGRYEYPEEEIIAAGVFNPAAPSLTLAQEMPYTDIELFVALNKGMLDMAFPNHGGKWYFTKLELARYHRKSTFRTVELKLLRNMNFKLTKSAVIADGNEVGQIYFSLVR